MYSSISFPNIDRTRFSFDSLAVRNDVIQYLDIQALLIHDEPSSKIGIVDMLKLEGVRSESCARALVPPAIFDMENVHFDGIVSDCYDAIRQIPHSTSTTPCLISSLSLGDSSLNSNDAAISVSPVCILDNLQSIQVIMAYSHGFFVCHVVSRIPGKGLSLERLEFDEAQLKGLKQVTFNGQLAFGSNWKVQPTKAPTQSKNPSPRIETEKSYRIQLLHAQRGILTVYSAEIKMRSLKVYHKSHIAKNSFRFTSKDFSVICMQMYQIAFNTVINTLKCRSNCEFPATLSEENEKRGPDHEAVFIGLLDGQLYTCEVSSEKCTQICVRSLNSDSEEKLTSRRTDMAQNKSVARLTLESAIDTVFLSVSCSEEIQIVACAIHTTFVEWIIQLKSLDSANDQKGTPLKLRQIILNNTYGHHIPETIRMAVPSDCGRSVTLLSKSRVFKLHPPRASCDYKPGDVHPEMCIDGQHRVNTRLVFREPETLLLNKLDQDIIHGTVPRYTFVDRIDRRFREMWRDEESADRWEETAKSLQHNLSTAGKLASAMWKYKSSAFPFYIFASPSACRVYYMHYTSSSQKLERTFVDNVERFKLNTLGMLPFDNTCCVVEYCESNNMGLEDNQIADKSTSWSERPLSMQLGQQHNLPGAFHHPWRAIDIRLWEEECVTENEYKLQSGKCRPVTIIENCEKSQLQAASESNTAIGKETVANAIERISQLVYSEDLATPEENTASLRPITFETKIDGATCGLCPFCKSSVNRFYDMLFPTNMWKPGNGTKTYEIFIRTKVLCEMGHQLLQCSLTGQIASVLSLEDGSFLKCQYCLSAYAVDSLLDSKANLACYECNLPFM